MKVVWILFILVVLALLLKPVPHDLPYCPPNPEDCG